MRRCLSTITGDSSILITQSRNFLTPNVNRGGPSRREYGSFQKERTDGNSTRWSSRTSRSQDYELGKQLGSKQDDKQQWLQSRGVRPANSPPRLPSASEKAIAKELTYLKDPLKLADYVRRSLRNDEFETAVAAIRTASKDIQCIVSWNHLVEYQLSRGQLNAAIKTYNEVCCGPHP
jgi:hypothetical protein